jgi:hypothetical protein
MTPEGIELWTRILAEVAIILGAVRLGWRRAP